MGWQQWVVSQDRAELIGPCGCRVPNSGEGLRKAKAHKCEETDDE